MIYIIVAILSGVSIVLARVINYVLAEKIGVFQGTFFNYVLGLAGSFILLLLSGNALELFNISAYNASWWAYTGGLLGVLVIALSSVLSAKTSTFYLTLFIFIGQLFAGIILDLIATGDFSLYKILGGSLVLMGLSYNLYIDKKTEAQS